MGILQFERLACRDCCKCVSACPVKSIEMKDHHAMIVERDCILCGSCIVACPRGAKHGADDLDNVRELFHRGRRVIASVAPSYAAYFDGCGFQALRTALMKLGFSDACETAEGAYAVKTAYEMLLRGGKMRTMISSCCPTLNLYIEKYCPETIPFLAPVLTPMEAHARLIHAREPDADVVFIGPCISKKAECLAPDSQVKYAVSFEDTTKWMQQNGVMLPSGGKAGEPRLSRAFPMAGGILTTMEKLPGHAYLSISGPEDCMHALADVRDGKLDGCFVEMSFCRDSCIGGPSFRKKKASAAVSSLRVRQEAIGEKPGDFSAKLGDDGGVSALAARFADRQIHYAMPTEQQIAAIYRKMGKDSVEDELNCGMCGYASCREKAIAVALGKAEITMCMPYMKKRAEAISDQIINITPNAILSVDLDLNVQQINHAACRMFSIRPEDILKQPVSRILDEFDFVSMISDGKTQLDKTTYYAEYGLYLNQAFFFDRAGGIVICIMKDITKERQQHNQLMQHKTQVARMADDMVDKQLRLVHEIASLLGESAAETKIAVSELKNTVMMEEEENQ